jgi:NAD(P)-dependent dehydrogenase (short-subunit alcohol dehydrogenase family)
MKNKSILITGGTTGIGLATAQLLSAEGAKIIVTGRNPATLAAAQKELPAGVIFLKSDSGNLADAQTLGDEIRKHTAKLDGAFLNAGIYQFGPVETMTPRHYDDMFNINVRGLFFQLQSILPLLSSPSSVVLNASVAAEIGMNGSSIYAATKAAVVSLGKTLAVELAPRGIRINTLSPGPVKTPGFDKLGLAPEAQQGMEDYLVSQSLFKRFGTTDEIARLARFLLSDESSFIVGENVTADGGVRLT